jgi:hypothetical protein
MIGWLKTKWSWAHIHYEIISFMLRRVLEWSLWSLKSGFSLMRHAQAAVFYRSRLGLRTMFCKGLLEARVAGRMVPNPPLAVARLFGEIFWNCAAVLRGRATLGFSLRRIAYFLGDFCSRRIKEKTV